MDIFATKIAHASVDSFVAKVSDSIINPLIYFLFALAVVYFLWGSMEFMLNQDNEEKKTEGRSHMLWGVMGIAIMMSVWAILGVVLSTLGINKSEIDPEKNHVDLSDYNPSVNWFDNN